MSAGTRITSIQFKNYKAFASYSVHLGQFNILVGPNNAGKSTVLGALRILAEGLRKARSRNPEFVSGPIGTTRGYKVDLRGLPVSTENVFHNYNDAEAALVTFRLSNANELLLFFPESGACNLIPLGNRPVRSTSNFKSSYDVTVAFVPVLGPVEHNETLFQPETARRALLSHGASRNFRNIWHHFPEGFDEFREKIRSSWPGMDIELPEVIYGADETVLRMTCPEERMPRELFWSGFGFQVWCQMLTFVLRAKAASLLVIDEPDIYLHSDLQRQLLSILRELGPDVVIATHSTEIISEVESDALLNINKNYRQARRIRNTRQLQQVFSILGSNLNPTLTQLAKTKRVVFVEGKDFQILGRLARRLGLHAVANRSHFAVVPVEGFNPQKVKDFSSGMEITLGTELVKCVIFDGDFRPIDERDEITCELKTFCWHAVVHDRNEIENFLLYPGPIARAISARLTEHGIMATSQAIAAVEVQDLLMNLAEPMKNKVQAQLVAANQLFERRRQPRLHASSTSEKIMDQFDEAWAVFATRMKLVPGKEMLSALNQHLQAAHRCSITPGAIANAFRADELPSDVVQLLNKLEELRTTTTATEAAHDPEDSGREGIQMSLPVLGGAPPSAARL